MKQTTVRVEVDPLSWAQGRNGMCQLGAIKVWTNGEGNLAYIDFETRKRKIILNGGAGVNVQAIDQFATEWIKARKLTI